MSDRFRFKMNGNLEPVISLWPDVGIIHQPNNEFVFYLVGGLMLIYLLSLLIAASLRRKEPSVIQLSPPEEIEDGQSSEQYIVGLTTSLLPGSSCSPEMKVYLQLVGTNAQSPYVYLKSNKAERKILQRGCNDMFIFQLKDYLGEVTLAKIITAGDKKMKWRLLGVNVFHTLSGLRWCLPFQILNTEDVSGSLEGLHFKAAELSCGCCKQMFEYHPWLSPFNSPIRFGAFSSAVNILMIFWVISLAMVGSLLAYAFTAPPAADDFNLNMMTIYASLAAGGCVWFVNILFELFLRNIRPGKRYQDKTHSNTNKKYIALEAQHGDGGKPLISDDLDEENDSCDPSLLKEYLVSPRVQKESSPRHQTASAEPLPRHSASNAKECWFDPNHHEEDSSSDAYLAMTESQYSDISQHPETHLEQRKSATRSGYQDSVSSLRSHVFLQSSTEFKSCTDIDPSSGSVLEILGRNDSTTLAENIKLEVLELEKESSDNNAGDEGFEDLVTPYLHLSDTSILPKPSADMSVYYSEELLPVVSEQQSMTTILEKFNPTLVLEITKLAQATELKLTSIADIIVSTSVKGVLQNMEEYVKNRRELLKAFAWRLVRQVVFSALQLQEQVQQGALTYKAIAIKVQQWSCDVVKQMWIHTNYKTLIEKQRQQQAGGASTIQSHQGPCSFEHLLPYLSHESFNILQGVVKEVGPRLESHINIGSADSELLSLMVVKAMESSTDNVRQFQADSLQQKQHRTDETNNSYVDDALEDMNILVCMVLQSVVRLAYRKHRKQNHFNNLVRLITADILRNSKSTLDYVDIEAVPSNHEMFTATNLCSTAIETAKKELWFEYQNPVFVCAQFLIRNTTVDRIKKAKREKTGIQRRLFSKSLRMLSRRWQNQGFSAITDDPEKMYSQVLLCSYVAEQEKSRDGSKRGSFMDEFLRLKNVEALLVEELMEKSQSLSEEILKEVERVTEHVNVSGDSLSVFCQPSGLAEMIDVHVDLAQKCLLESGETCLMQAVTEEEIAHMASFLASDAIELATNEVAQETRVDSDSEEIEADIEVESLNEDDITELMKDLKPLRGYMTYCQTVEKHTEKEMVEKRYLKRHEKKHRQFTAINLQNVCDSYFITDENLNMGPSDKDLYQLEWDMSKESTKCLPSQLKPLMVLLIFCMTMFGFLYCTLVTGQFTVTQVTEWTCCFMMAVGEIGLILEPFKAVIIGNIERCQTSFL